MKNRERFAILFLYIFDMIRYLFIFYQNEAKVEIILSVAFTAKKFSEIYQSP